jgi:hypothetical protein
VADLVETMSPRDPRASKVRDKAQAGKHGRRRLKLRRWRWKNREPKEEL